MILRGRQCKMPCESCAIQFSVFKRKRACSECERYYCSGCLRRGGGIMCAPCRILSTRPLSRQNIAHLKVRDLQCFLQRQNVSTRGCVEKEELLNLCVSHVNSAAYRRRGSRANNSAFSTFKGLTTNINDFINSAFDLRNPTSSPSPHPPSTRSNCFNSTHLHSPATNRQDPYVDVPDRHFTTTPGGETNIEVPLPEPVSPVDIAASETHIHVDTTDCFEIEDLDDTGWEFVSRPADPLPNDSAVLMSSAGSGSNAEGTVGAVGAGGATGPGSAAAGGAARAGVTGGAGAAAGAGGATGAGGAAWAGDSPQRAASSLELRSASTHDLTSADVEPDTSSLQDEPGLMEPQPPRTHHDLADGSPQHVDLSRFKVASELESLNVKQLKELLMRNRVEYKGCLERNDLLERAKMLWRDHEKYNNEPADLPIEDSCKICMAAPLECVLLECGHIAACTQCARQLAECPICRQYVVRAVRFFRS